MRGSRLKSYAKSCVLLYNFFVKMRGMPDKLAGANL